MESIRVSPNRFETSRVDKELDTYVFQVRDRNVDDVVQLPSVLEILDDLLGLRAEALVKRESVGSVFVVHLEVVLCI
jgi:hypothetical protein